jgi:putative transposase
MRGVLREGSPVTGRYEFIEMMNTGDAKYAYPVALMCRWLGVSRSGFYEWRNRSASAATQRRKELKTFITKAFTDSDGTYGYRRVHAQLSRWGVSCGPELVRALMRELGLVGCQPRPWRPVTTVAGDAAAIPDLVGRDFTAAVPGTKMVGDITYIRTWEGWLYLATVIDCATKEVIGYSMAEHMRASLVCDALVMACRNHQIGPGAVFHSDRGCQYTSEQFAVKAREFGVRRSMGRTGVCFDNAMAESFNAALKTERVHRTVYPTREHARTDIARYIEFRYNRRRLHSGLGYKTPYEARQEFWNRQSAA